MDKKPHNHFYEIVVVFQKKKKIKLVVWLTHLIKGLPGTKCKRVVMF